MASDPEQGRGLFGAYLPGKPDSAEQRTGGDAGGVLPGGERAHGAELGVAVGHGDGHRVGL